MNKNGCQHCISVMRVELLKLSIFAPKKLCGRRTVNRSETCTTLILDRYKQAEEKRQRQYDNEIFAA